MEYEHESRIVSFLSGLLLGAVIGAGVALVTAPESGRRTRKRIRRAAGDLRDSASDRWEGLRDTASDRWDNLSDDVRGKVDTAIQGARKRLST